MKWISTIRTRFALWSTGLILAMLATFGIFVYFGLSFSLHSAVDEGLTLSAAQTAATLNVANGQILKPEPITPDETGSQAFGERGLTLIVLAQDGSVLQAVGPYHAFAAPTSGSNTQGKLLSMSIPNESDPIRVYSLPVMDNTQIVGWVQAMQSLGEVDDSLQRLLTALLLGGGILSLLAGFAGYFLASRALAPIDDITSTAQRISTEDLSARLELPDTADEVNRLATTFNDMLSRIESGFTRERQFTANASHELRTPLAAMQAILSVVREGARPAQEYREALDDLGEETDRLRALVEDLLRLARGEAGLELQLETLDLAGLLSGVADSLQQLAQVKGLYLKCELPSILTIRGDTDQLIRLFVNLVDNAIKYTERGGVTLTARKRGGVTIVGISDSGIGIAQAHLPHIFERFYRIESSRSSRGAGLGLAISRQIAQAHGGTLEAQSSPSGGSTFIVKLPS
jgi:heavy metal sensor kinase